MNETQCRIVGALIHDWQVDNGEAKEVRIAKYSHDTYLVTLEGRFVEGNGHVGGHTPREGYYIGANGKVTRQS